MKTNRLLCALILTMAAFTSAAAGQPILVHPSSLPVLYGASTDVNGNWVYYAIYPASGTVRQLGPTAFVVPQDAAYDPVHNVRYSTTWNGETSPQLWVTDGESGITSLLGTLDLPYALPLDLAYDLTTRMLFLSSDATTGPNNLFRIEPATLQVTLVGSSGLGSIGRFGWDRSQEVLYASSTLTVLTVDTNSGQANLFASVDQSVHLTTPAVDALGQNLYVIGYPADSSSRTPPYLFVYSIAEGRHLVSIPLHGDIDSQAGPVTLFFHRFRN
jgi:hypothetical protein